MAKKVKAKTKEEMIARWDQRQTAIRKFEHINHRLAFSPENVQEVNEMRRVLGMSQVTLKNRNCLRCDIIFESKGSNHRMCGECRDKYY